MPWTLTLPLARSWPEFFSRAAKRAVPPVVVAAEPRRIARVIDAVKDNRPCARLCNTVPLLLTTLATSAGINPLVAVKPTATCPDALMR